MPNDGEDQGWFESLKSHNTSGAERSQPLTHAQRCGAALRTEWRTGSLFPMAPADPERPSYEEIPADLLDGADELAPPEEQERFAEWLRTGKGELWNES